MSGRIFLRSWDRWAAHFARRALASVAVLAVLFLAWTPAAPAIAKDMELPGASKIKPGEQMLVESDQLVYDYDHNTVSAVGNVKIYYGGYTLEAEKVTYLKATGKLIASGTVKMTDPSGIVLYAEDIDVTQDFADGFVKSLRVDTPNRTHFAARQADRSAGSTTFYNGVYTACEPCKDHPERPPTWQIKAKKIVDNSETKMVSFEDATFEFAGIPLAYLPYFQTADPSVTRKTGFLAPSIGYGTSVGWSATTPYFIALAPSYDLTVIPTYYTDQGLLGELDWRQRLANGEYTLKMAGIFQNDPKGFLTYDNAGNVVGGTFAQEDFRGGIRTTGNFDFNQWWSYGWDATFLTDRTFTRNYNVLSTAQVEITSDVFLTGLHDRNYFDARAEEFQILADKTDPKYSQERQAVIAPILDHNYIFSNPILGGELSMNSNLVAFTRNEADPFTVGGQTFYHGLSGDFARASYDVDWQRKMIGPLGQVFTPFASVRADVFSIDASTPPAELTNESTPTRLMPTLGLEWTWPILITAGESSHVIAPVAQFLLRPDEPLAGKLNNDDAQSLVFDDTVLFRRDKFSGYDRVEGGSRANLGLRYNATFGNGLAAEGLFGQSIVLGGRNSFATPDLADVGAYSGLETNFSDYVAELGLEFGAATRLSFHGRFDNADFSMNRGEVDGTTTVGALTASVGYLYAREIPQAGIVEPTSQVTGSASWAYHENWRVFGTAVVDLVHQQTSSSSLGVAFDNGCLSLSLAYSQAVGVDIPSRELMFRLALRTLVEGNVGGDLNGVIN